MSASIDLLPPEVLQRRVDARNLQAAGGVLGILLLALLLLWAGQARRLTAAEEARDGAQAQLQALRAEETALGEFGDLDRQLQAAELQLAGAMGSEVGFAGLLQDFAAVLPTDASIQNLTLDTFGSDGVGSVLLAGETRRGIAPGLERLLISLDKVSSLSDPQLTSTSVDGEYTAFTLQLQVGPDARTERYAAGLPEGLR